MKRLTALLLLAAMLAGCSGTAEPTTEPTETAETTEATIALDESIDPLTAVDESIETVDAYSLTYRSCARIIPWGDSHYALFTTGGQLLRLSRDGMALERSRDLECQFSSGDTAISATADRLFYFDEGRSTGFILDRELTATAQLPIAGEILAGPVMSPDFQSLYYCTADGVRVMDTATGISRLLRQEHGTIIQLEGLLDNGSILHYTRLVDTNQLEHCFIHTADGTLTENGSFRGTDPADQVAGWDSSYAALSRLSLPMGERWLLRLGDPKLESRLMFFQTGLWSDALVLDNGTVFLQTLREETLVMELYDLTDGSILAAATLPNRIETFPYVQTDGSALWLWDDQQVRVYRWDHEKDAAADKNLFDLQNEDATVQQAEEKRLAMEAAYGVPIQITQRYSRSGSAQEWLGGQYMQVLTLLDTAMAKFPQGFFTSMQDELRIELVDDFNLETGELPATGSMEIGDSLTIQVSMCPDVQAIFYHELFHAMELHIQSNTSRLTKWEDQNPKALRYASLEAYEAGELRESEFLSSVADDYALVSPREDRAQTFMYAMLGGENGRFESSVMGKKLDLLCDAIRDAFGWQNSGTAFPWEQYLP